MEGTEVSGVDVQETLYEGADDVEEAGPLGQGTTVGRYVVLSRIGAGGMGVVYSAYDPELDRKVALKLLRASLVGGAGASAGTTRLLREAQAMGKLTHPNVVRVYDVGRYGDGVFLAMEFVEGQTFGSWVDKDRPGWRAIVGAYRHAAVGLAAAHDKGLVHRDVKPENVMIADDGGVLVMDFGLARPHTEQEEPGQDSGGPTDLEPSRNVLQAPLTEMGSRIGTPAYMAPEQHSGLSTDARSDQFSFCVALWEAVYGERPFAGETAAALAFNVTQGELRAPPRGREVPTWVRRALERGLQVDPAKRWASMRELAQALEPPRRQNWAWLLTGGLLFTALAWWFVLGGEERVDVCDNAADAVTARWSEGARTGLDAAYEGAQSEFVRQTWARARPRLDSWFQAMATARTDACQATHLAATQSGELYDRRIACFDRQLARAELLVEQLAEPSPAVAEAMLDAIDALPDLQDCDPARVLDETQVSTELQAKLDPLLRQLDEVQTRRQMGAASEALKLLDAISGEVDGLAHPPLRARYELERARNLARTSDFKAAGLGYTAALESAMAGKDVELRWEIALESAELLDQQLQKSDAAQQIFAVADGLGRRIDTPYVQMRAERVRASLLIQRGKSAEAVAHNERAREAAKKANPTLRERSALIRQASEIARTRGQVEQALALAQQNQAMVEEAYGPSHPATARAILITANASYLAGHQEQAIEDWKRCVAMYDETLGPDDPSSLACAMNVPTALMEMGLDEDVVTEFEAVIARVERIYGPNHRSLAATLNNLVGALDDPERAHATAQRALQIARDGEMTGPHMAMILGTAASAAWGVGDGDEAKALSDQAREIVRQDSSNHLAADILAGAAKIALDTGTARKEVRGMLEEALEVGRASEIGAYVVAGAEFEMARFLWDGTASEKREALEFARAAERHFDEAKLKPKADKVRAWLDEHDPG